jgi:hypothetical protein
VRIPSGEKGGLEKKVEVKMAQRVLGAGSDDVLWVKIKKKVMFFNALRLRERSGKATHPWHLLVNR